MKYEREIARLAYDGEYEKAINRLLDIIVEQDKEIKEFKKCMADAFHCLNTEVISKLDGAIITKIRK